MTHNENLIPLLNLLINCTYARSAPKTLSLSDEYTYFLLIFLIIRLSNPSANC